MPPPFYHVMNHGRGRLTIFHEEVYYQSFLDILTDACDRFDCIVHAYCLMGNHYHLLIETPEANLSQVMHHMNRKQRGQVAFLKKWTKL